MSLALFDLDETLLPKDSDYLWSLFMVEEGYITDKKFPIKKDLFKQQYNNGTLDIHNYVQFMCHYFNLLGKNLHIYQAEFIKKIIKPMISIDAINLVKKHKSQGDYTIIVTATSEVIVNDIAQYFEVDKLLAIELETVGGRNYRDIPKDETVIFTGAISGEPSFREGKVKRIKSFINRNPEYTLEDSYFYSDSRNDIPLLETVTHPFAVNPDPYLKQYAQRKSWEIIDLHNKENQ